MKTVLLAVCIALLGLVEATVASSFARHDISLSSQRRHSALVDRAAKVGLRRSGARCNKNGTGPELTLGTY